MSKHTAQSDGDVADRIVAAPRVLVTALVFGVAFGFLLQKAGVAKFDILIGVLLLEDFTVVKVMVSAIIVGLVGFPILHRAGLVEPSIKPTVLGANLAGGLLFGVGFGLLAYCPGTNAAALGQGNLDAIVGVLGMLAGSYLYALAPPPRAIKSAGDLGKQRLTALVGLPSWVVTAIAVAVLAGALVLIEATTAR